MNPRHFGLKKLKLRLFENKDGTENRFPLGAPNNFFAMILEGHAHFTASGKTVDLAPLELLYIPKGVAYTSSWYGAPACRFYSLAFQFESHAENARFALQKLPLSVLSDIDISREDLDAVMCENADTWGVLALFYRLYGKTAPLLRPAKAPILTEGMRRVLDLMEGDPAGEFDVPALARIASMSESGFYAAFKKAIGCTPMAYKNMLRARHAVELLKSTDMTVEEIAARLSCSSASYLRRLLASATGKTPKELRRERASI